jgi:hypothetical protein
MKPLNVLLTAMVIYFCVPVSAQDKLPVKFGKVNAEDFNLSRFSFDSSANAVVIADVGSTTFEGNSKGWFSLLFKHQKRVKILNKNGFDAASESITLFFDGDAEEKLENLKAITYNLENGKVVETKLDNASVFKDKLSKNRTVRKFTFPAVKEGSIIELSYTIKSDFLRNLQPWSFQGDLPRIWSEYEVQMPGFFNYVYLSQGYHAFHAVDKKTAFRTFNVLVPGSTATERNESYTFSGEVQITKWVMKNVPPMKEESYTSAIDNHIAKVEFQLSAYRDPLTPRDIMGNWQTVTADLMKNESFAGTLAKNNNWLDDDMKVITAGATTELEKAKRIYAFVRDNFTCTNHRGFFLSSNLRNVFKVKNGSVSDINLLLVSMLLHQGIKADPVILSTRDHGVIHDFYPLMDRFNYVISTAQIDGKRYFLDASHSDLGFGRLPTSCYNGYARVISTQPGLVNLAPDSLLERKVTSVFLMNDPKEGIVGTLRSQLGYFQSLAVRNAVKSKGREGYLNDMKSNFGSDLVIKEALIDSLKKLEEPVVVNYEMKFKMEEDIIYFNPLMSEALKENFFKAAQRRYPVEMPYTFDETFVLNMEVPKDYTLEEIPKSAKVSFNDGEGIFEYLIAKDNDKIQLRSRVVLKKAYFLPEEYEPLREFIGYVVKKHSEQIVFKKKKSANP